MSLTRNITLVAPVQNIGSTNSSALVLQMAENLLTLLIKTYREATESLPAILPSPAKNAPMAPAYSISSQMGSMAPAELEYEVSSSKGYTSSSLVATEMTDWDYLFGGDHPEYIWNDNMSLPNNVSVVFWAQICKQMILRLQIKPPY